MKKLFLITMLSCGFITNIQAAELKKESLYCIDSKSIIKYYNFVEKGYDNYAKKIIDKSDCFIKKRAETVIIKSEQKKYIELELLSGFKVWTKQENVIRQETM